MFDLLSIGDVKLDTFIAIPSASVLCNYKKTSCELCIAHGKKIPVDKVEQQIAGSAPNVAIGVKKLGRRSAVMSTMGQDNIYRDTKRFLKDHGVSVRYLRAVPGAQSSFSAVLNYEGESTQLAAHAHTSFQIPKYWPRMHWMHLSELGSGYADVFEAIIARKKRSPFLLSFNPGAVQISEKTALFDEILRVTDLLFVNKLEAEIICGKTDADIPDLLAHLAKKVAGSVIITDGKAGAYAMDRKMNYHAPMFPGERVEATGAGDAFTTGVLGALLHDLSLSDALAWGSVNAASVVQYIGPTQGLLSVAQIKDDLKTHAEYRVIPI